MDREFTLHVLALVRQGYVELEALSPHLSLRRVPECSGGRFEVRSCSGTPVESRFAAMCARCWKCVRQLPRAGAPLPVGRSDEEHAYRLLFRDFSARLHTETDPRNGVDPITGSQSSAGSLVLPHAVQCMIELLDRLSAEVESGPPPSSELIDVRDAAALIGMSEKTVRRWKKAKLLNVYGDRKMFNRAEVLERAPALRRRRPRTKRATNSRSQREIAGHKPGSCGQKGT